MHKKPVSITPKALHLLEALKGSHTGAAIYEHVQNVLEDFETSAHQRQQAYLDLIQSLLEAYARQLPKDSSLLIHLKLIKMRLALPLSVTEIRALAEQIRTLSQKLDEEIALPQEQLEKQLEDTVGDKETPAAETDAGAPSPAMTTAETAAQAPGGAEQRVHGQEDQERTDQSPAADSTALAPATGKGGEETEGISPVQDNTQLEDKRQRIRKIQKTLASHLADVIKQNEKFGILLEVEHESLRQTDNLDDITALKEALIKEVTKLMEGHRELTRKLESANKYLHIIESEGQYLNDELTRVHILSLTDELTELPNRRAFMRRLEDEVARVQRYGYPLTLALLDMDGFKKINDTLGHAAGDEVLRNFAGNVLTIFRHHDMVARYGGEEFAVILPNTDQHGALRALQKVQKRTAESPYQFNGETRAMPTFSAGVALYRPGETPSSLIERADKALYQAKRRGRNRIELANNDQLEISAR